MPEIIKKSSPYFGFIDILCVIYGIIIIAIVIIMKQTVYAMPAAVPVACIGCLYILFGPSAFCSECPTLLIVHAAMLFLLLVAQICVGIHIVTNELPEGYLVERSVNFASYYFNHTVKHRKAFEEMHIMDTLQRNMKCCGVYSYTDYVKLMKVLPPSCCGFDTRREYTPCFLEDKHYKEGCIKPIRRNLRTCYTALAGLMFFCLIPLCGLIFIIRFIRYKHIF